MLTILTCIALAALLVLAVGQETYASRGHATQQTIEYTELGTTVQAPETADSELHRIRFDNSKNASDDISLELYTEAAGAVSPGTTPFTVAWPCNAGKIGGVSFLGSIDAVFGSQMSAIAVNGPGTAVAPSSQFDCELETDS